MVLSFVSIAIVQTSDIDTILAFLETITPPPSTVRTPDTERAPEMACLDMTRDPAMNVYTLQGRFYHAPVSF